MIPQLPNKIRALVIDDKRVIFDMFNFFLGFQGHSITYVNNPQDAIDIIKNENFDIAFCDIVMPDKDGITLLQELKSISPKLPVVMMSGFTLEPQRKKARELGAIDCLNKPMERRDIQRVIKVATGIDI